MQIDVSKLLQSKVGDTSSYKLSEKVENFDKEIKLISPISGEVKLLRTDEGILAQGNIETTLELKCSRCLEMFKKKIKIDFEQEYVPSWEKNSDEIREEERQEGFIIDESNKIDILETVRQDILINMPMELVCKSSCRSLCDQCGQNLNIKKCKCKKVKSISERKLKDFLK